MNMDAAHMYWAGVGNARVARVEYAVDAAFANRPCTGGKMT
jgi:hypothetical protein